METTPSREDWEKQKADIKKEWGIFIQYPDEEHTSNWWFDKIELILKSRDEALVAEIERLKVQCDMCENNEIHDTDPVNKTLDAVIRLIQKLYDIEHTK